MLYRWCTSSGPQKVDSCITSEKKITQRPPLQTNPQLRLALEGSYPLPTKCCCLDTVYPQFQSNQRWSLHSSSNTWPLKVEVMHPSNKRTTHMFPAAYARLPQQPESCAPETRLLTQHRLSVDGVLESRDLWMPRINWTIVGMPPNHSSQFLRHSNIL